MTTPTPTKPMSTPPEAAPSEPRVVKYTGFSGTREISIADWKSAGVEDQAKLIRWNEENNYEVPASDFSEAALEVLKRDPDMKLPKS